jgi:hypothetical protein
MQKLIPKFINSKFSLRKVEKLGRSKSERNDGISDCIAKGQKLIPLFSFEDFSLNF